MRISVLILGLICIVSLNTSCVSNYVVSKNSYLPTSSEKYAKVKKPVKTYAGLSDHSNDLQNILNSDELKVEDVSFDIEAEQLLSEAKTYLGTPYRFGGTTRRGIDCSAFVQSVFETKQIYLPRTSILQWKKGISVSLQDLRKGDLVFFNTRGRRVSHVGIVERISEEGEIFFIHASSSQGVTVSSLSSSYWSSRYLGARRVREI